MEKNDKDAIKTLVQKLNKDQIFIDDAIKTLVQKSGIIFFGNKMITYLRGKYIVMYDGKKILEDISVGKAVSLYNDLKIKK